VSRKDRIAARVVDLLLPVSGRERSQIDTAATFMEQGFDSLSLTQVAFAIRKEFSAKVSFSQLMNQWPNVDLLAAHLDGTLPADILAEAPLIPAPLPVSPLPAAPSAVDVRPDVRITNSVLEEVVAALAHHVHGQVVHHTPVYEQMSVMGDGRKDSGQRHARDPA